MFNVTVLIGLDHKRYEETATSKEGFGLHTFRVLRPDTLETGFNYCHNLNSDKNP